MGIDCHRHLANVEITHYRLNTSYLADLLQPVYVATMDYAIETRDLSVTFSSNGRTVNALDSLNLRVLKGQVFGFLGSNGAGKTTTMHVLLGFIEATAGKASILGTDVRLSIARQNN
jgi:ABC-type uncharacterized transport system ATPase subunit